MDNALLASLANQIVQRRTMDVIANNLANMNTTGFKRESPVFEPLRVDVNVQRALGHRKEPIYFVRDVLATHDMSNGSLELTGNPLDVGLEGDGFFTVQTKDGVRYTRNGAFGLDDTGRLVTSAGNAVLDDGGSEITFSPDESDINISRDGTISTAQGRRGRLGIASFQNPQTLEVTGDSLWQATEPALPADSTAVKQGFIETSNVKPVVEMTRMIETMRSYQQSVEMFNSTEELVRRAVQKLGEVRV